MLMNQLKEKDLPYPDSDEIPEKKIKNEEEFKSGEKISDYLRGINSYNDSKFSLCQNCHVENNVYYCKRCERHFCERCCQNPVICEHLLIEKIDLRTLSNEVNEAKESMHSIIKNIFIKLQKENPKEKSQKIYDEKDLDIDQNKKEIDNSIVTYEKPYDLELIDRIIGADYINYFHYNNIFECKKYLENRYNKCFKKPCLIINYNTQGINIGNEIRIFGELFVENNKNKFFLIINNEYFEKLISKITLQDNYLEVILVKKTENKITTLNSMFKNCILFDNFNFEKYKDHDLVDFNDVEDISFMINGCTGLVKLDLSLFGSFEQGKLKSMACTFSQCNRLKTINGIEKWKTDNVEKVTSMFNGCQALTNVEGIQNFNTQNMTDFSNMFYGCVSLKYIPDLSKWNNKMKKAEKLNGMFKECRSLVELPDISKWEIKNVTTMEGMFCGCSALISLPYFSQWDMGKVETIEEMFRGCSALTSCPDYLSWKNLDSTVPDTRIFD